METDGQIKYIKNIYKKGYKHYFKEFPDVEESNTKFNKEDSKYLDIYDKKNNIVEFWHIEENEDDRNLNYELWDYKVLTKEEIKIFNRYQKAWELMKR